ncbi:hypothetical protein [Rheinheimera sp.]|uniref:hypothetical protein n=1 Tax=Rheinheimera sp. TaxID=1869214 RepID=UPI002FDD7548
MQKEETGLSRFLTLLPKDADLDLVILKGHLLIEEVLSDKLREFLKLSNPLGIQVNERMMFSEKLRFYWSLKPKAVEDRVWQSLKELNQIRNAMAHSIEPKGIHERVEKFSREIIEYSKLEKMVVEERKVGFSLAWLYILLATEITIKQT